MADPTLTLSAEQIETWTGWARRDDWHNLFVGSEIRQMLGEIGRLHTTLAAEIERRELAEAQLEQWPTDVMDALDEVQRDGEDCLQACQRIKATVRSFEIYKSRAETAERALAEAHRHAENSLASWLLAENEYKSELAKLRAPVSDVEAQVFHAYSENGRGQMRSAVVPANIARQLAAQVRERDARIAVLSRIAWLIGSIYCHGNFKAETVNERELEQLLRSADCFWPTVADFDAALNQPARGEG